jgi:hypothetical protein
MAVLRIGWSNLTKVAPAKPVVTTGSEGDEGAEPAAPEVKRADKPILVYVADPTVTEGFDKVEQVVMTEDKIVIGTKAFTCVRMTPEQADQDELLVKAGKGAPRVVFISADYQDVEALEGDKLSIGKMWGEMNAQFKKHYKGDLEKNVKAMLKVLGEFDKIANERKLLDEKKARADKPSDADKKEWDKAAKELDAREKAANAERDALLKFEPKSIAS